MANHNDHLQLLEKESHDSELNLDEASLSAGGLSIAMPGRSEATPPPFRLNTPSSTSPIQQKETEKEEVQSEETALPSTKEIAIDNTGPPTQRKTVGEASLTPPPFRLNTPAPTAPIQQKETVKGESPSEETALPPAKVITMDNTPPPIQLKTAGETSIAPPSSFGLPVMPKTLTPPPFKLVTTPVTQQKNAAPDEEPAEETSLQTDREIASGGEDPPPVQRKPDGVAAEEAPVFQLKALTIQRNIFSYDGLTSVAKGISKQVFNEAKKIGRTVIYYAELDGLLKNGKIEDLATSLRLTMEKLKLVNMFDSLFKSYMENQVSPHVKFVEDLIKKSKKKNVSPLEIQNALRHIEIAKFQIANSSKISDQKSIERKIYGIINENDLWVKTKRKELLQLSLSDEVSYYIEDSIIDNNQYAKQFLLESNHEKALKYALFAYRSTSKAEIMANNIFQKDGIGNRSAKRAKSLALGGIEGIAKTGTGLIDLTSTGMSFITGGRVGKTNLTEKVDNYMGKVQEASLGATFTQNSLPYNFWGYSPTARGFGDISGQVVGGLGLTKGFKLANSWLLRTEKTATAALGLEKAGTAAFGLKKATLAALTAKAAKAAQIVHTTANGVQAIGTGVKLKDVISQQRDLGKSWGEIFTNGEVLAGAVDVLSSGLLTFKDASVLSSRLSQKEVIKNINSAAPNIGLAMDAGSVALKATAISQVLNDDALTSEEKKQKVNGLITDVIVSSLKIHDGIKDSQPPGSKDAREALEEVKKLNLSTDSVSEPLVTPPQKSLSGQKPKANSKADDSADSSIIPVKADKNKSSTPKVPPSEVSEVLVDISIFLNDQDNAGSVNMQDTSASAIHTDSQIKNSGTPRSRETNSTISNDQPSTQSEGTRIVNVNDIAALSNLGNAKPVPLITPQNAQSLVDASVSPSVKLGQINTAKQQQHTYWSKKVNKDPSQRVFKLETEGPASLLNPKYDKPEMVQIIKTIIEAKSSSEFILLRGGGKRIILDMGEDVGWYIDGNRKATVVQKLDVRIDSKGNFHFFPYQN